MWQPEEPNGRFGRWCQVASSLATFGFLAFLIIFVILDRIVDAPAWALVAASVPIAAFSIAWGFTVIEDDEVEPEMVHDGEKLRWVYDRPKGFIGWALRIASVWFTFGALLALSDLLLIQLLDLSKSVWIWSGILLLALAIALQFFDIEDEEDDRAGLPDHAPTRDGPNARFHELANSDQG